jgi:hypothetical protein
MSKILPREKREYIAELQRENATLREVAQYAVRECGDYYDWQVILKQKARAALTPPAQEPKP